MDLGGRRLMGNLPLLDLVRRQLRMEKLHSLRLGSSIGSLPKFGDSKLVKGKVMLDKVNQVNINKNKLGG